MDRRTFIAAAANAAVIASAPQALALRGGAILDHAVPGVGLTAPTPVREVRLYFDLGVLAASVQVRSSTGSVIAASRPSIDSSGHQTVAVRFGRALPPGTYIVSWHVISIARRSTWGTFRFTVF